MTHVPYSYVHPHSRRYVFISIGKKRIEKVVDFIPLKGRNYMNLGFGDLLSDGSLDDKANSNNGDLIKVMATVVDIVKHFTAQHPKIIIFFAGSTLERTRLYTRILKSYYPVFSGEFAIFGIIGNENEGKTIPFDPLSDIEYLAFLIRRIN
jgi:hypothetical protein